MSWFRRYRPATIGELDLGVVRDAFQEMMAAGSIPQVLLFAGPKGTGKTSSARILAGMLNEKANAALVDHLFFGQAKPAIESFVEPDLSDPLIQKIHQGTSFVVQEMDAASHRGIDDVRALKEKVNLPPTEGKISVFILDEVHMLTTEAFNALLKLLEEPPAHVVFILATTEIQKIPETVQSRCTQIRFHRASQEEIVGLLKKIAQKEKIKVSDSALELIATTAEGSFRDAVKLLELLATPDQELSLELVQKKLHAVQTQTVANLLQAVLDKDELLVTRIFADLRQIQTDENDFFKKLLNFLYRQLKISLGEVEGKSFASRQVIVFFLRELTQTQLNFHLPIPLLSLELIFLDLVFRAQKKNPSSSSPASSSSTPKQTKLTSSPKQSSSKLKIKTSAARSGADSLPTEVVSHDLSPIKPGDAHKLLDSWHNFLKLVNQKQASVAMLLQTAKPIKAENDQATISVFYPFHKERLEDASTLDLLQKCVEPLVGGSLRFNFALSHQESLATEAIGSGVDELPELAKEALL